MGLKNAQVMKLESKNTKDGKFCAAALANPKKNLQKFSFISGE